MKTKKSKDWVGRVKDIDELHHDSQNWLSEIEFIKDEMKFLTNLLSSHYIDLMDTGRQTNIKEFVKEISVEKKTGKALYTLIHDHEKVMSDLINAKSVTTNKNYLDTHRKFEQEMIVFLRRYKKLKKGVFKMLELTMKKKHQKNLPKVEDLLKIDKE
jgi:hypothetical protein